MLSYWILRDPSGKPNGLVRVENDRVLLTCRTPLAAEFRLFSETADTPILPDRETQCGGAVALLGMQNGTPVAFAASAHAQPLSVYRARMSQIYTIEVSEPVKEPAPAPPAQKPENSPVPLVQAEDAGFSDVSDTARATEAFTQMLKRAEAFYARFETCHPAAEPLVQKEDSKERGIDLLPQLFPGARWRYIEGQDLLGHYEGDYRYPNGARIRILAVQGKSAPRPPRTLTGFTRFVRAPDGTGYWLRFLPME